MNCVLRGWGSWAFTTMSSLSPVGETGQQGFFFVPEQCCLGGQMTWIVLTILVTLLSVPSLRVFVPIMCWNFSTGLSQRHSYLLVIVKVNASVEWGVMMVESSDSTILLMSVLISNCSPSFWHFVPGLWLSVSFPELWYVPRVCLFPSPL